LILRIIFATGLFFLHSCYQIKTSIDYHPHSVPEIKQAQEKIAKKVGLEKVSSVDSIDTFFSQKALYGYKYILESNSKDSTKVKTISFSPTETVTQNLHLSFRSFLTQELDKKHVTANSGMFYKLTPKSKDEYYKRNWIFMAYGIDYLAENNPYVSQGDYTFAKIFYSILEIGLYAGMVSGPFIGKTDKAKVMIPIINAAGLVTWKLMLPWLEGDKKIESYNNIANSGYSIPMGVK
jgi:hypothetical protein